MAGHGKRRTENKQTAKVRERQVRYCRESEMESQVEIQLKRFPEQDGAH